MTKGNKPLESNDFDFEDWVKPRRQPAGVITPIPTGYPSGDTSGGFPDALVPWERAAGYLAAELVPDNESKRAEAIEAYSRTHPGRAPPLLDGKESDRAYLAVMRTAESKRIEDAIHVLIASGALKLVTPGANLPTKEKSGALISTAQVLRLMRDSQHLVAPRWDADADAAAKGARQVKAPDLIHEAAESVVAARVVPLATRTHRLQRDLLAPVIDRACSAVTDSTDSASVMAELERLARLPDRPTPLSGVTSGGIQWRVGGIVKILTRKALGDRLRRRARQR